MMSWRLPMTQQQTTRMVPGVDWGDGESTTVRARVVMNGDQLVSVDIEDELVDAGPVDLDTTRPFTQEEIEAIVRQQAGLR